MRGIFSLSILAYFIFNDTEEGMIGMIKRLVYASLCLLVVLSGVVSPRTLLVEADERVLEKPMMALGASLTPEQVEETRRLLGDSTLPNREILRVDGALFSKYLPTSNSQGEILSSVYLKPMPEGYGVQVDIVTPSKITRVSSDTFQNAIITSGVTDVLVRVASVNEVTGEGALVGVYALLEQEGLKIGEKTIQVSQNEVELIDTIKEISNLNDSEANKVLGELKKRVTQRVTSKQRLSEEWLQEAIFSAFERRSSNIDEKLLKVILNWLSDYATTEVANKAETLQQLDQSLLLTSWLEVLSTLDKGLAPEDILKLERQDYSDATVYPVIVKNLYNQLLNHIKDENLVAVKTIYSHSFVIEKFLGIPSAKESEALNYIRMLCYYFIAYEEDLNQANNFSKDFSWRVGGTTKENLLVALERYEQLNQLPELKEIINRIAIATGYAYEAYSYEDFSQKGDILTVTIQCFCSNQEVLRVQYNVKTGKCQLVTDGKTKDVESYDFKRAYGVKVDNSYQALVDDVSNYRLLAEDKMLVSIKARNKAAHIAYKHVLEEYVEFVTNGELSFEGYTYLNKEHTRMESLIENRNFYYGILDVNGDGLSELLVTDDTNNVLLGFYTFDGRSAVQLGGTGYRSELVIFQDGIIRHAGSGGALSSGASFYYLPFYANSLKKNIVVDKEFDLSGNKVTYTVKEEGTGRENSYDTQESFSRSYAYLLPYLAGGTYQLVDSDEKATILDFSNFKSMTDLVGDNYFDQFEVFEEETVEDEVPSQSKQSESLSSFFLRLWSNILSFFKEIGDGNSSQNGLDKHYQKVLEEYRLLSTLTRETANGRVFKYLNNSQVDWFVDRDEKLAYDVYDINQDGQDELIIGDIPSNQFRVTGVYTFDGQEVVNLTFAELDSYRLDLLSGFNIYQDGVIRYFTEASADGMAYYYGRIEGDQLVMFGNYETSQDDYIDYFSKEKLNKAKLLEQYGSYDANFGRNQIGNTENNNLKINPKLISESDISTQPNQPEHRMIVKQIEQGNYISLEGYWMSDSGDVVTIGEYGPTHMEPGFKGLKTGEERHLDDEGETILSRHRADDGNLMDSITISKSNRSIFYKYVPKGEAYLLTLQENDPSVEIAEEDLILVTINGGDGRYTVYRKSPHGELVSIVGTAMRKGGVIFSVTSSVVLESSPPDFPVSIYRFDARDVVDYYNTYNKGTYSLDDVLDNLEVSDRRAGKLSSLSQADLEDLRATSDVMTWIYFKGDQQLIFFMGATGLSGEFPIAADVSEWLFEGEQVIVPVIKSSDKSYVGQVILKKNNKKYSGGRKKSSYYIYDFRKEE